MGEREGLDIDLIGHAIMLIGVVGLFATAGYRAFGI